MMVYIYICFRDCSGQAAKREIETDSSSSFVYMYVQTNESLVQNSSFGIIIIALRFRHPAQSDCQTTQFLFRSLSLLLWVYFCFLFSFIILFFSSVPFLTIPSLCGVLCLFVLSLLPIAVALFCFYSYIIFVCVRLCIRMSTARFCLYV